MCKLDKHQFCNRERRTILDEQYTDLLKKQLVLSVIMTNTAQKSCVEYHVVLSFPRKPTQMKVFTKMDKAIEFYNAAEEEENKEQTAEL